MSSLFVCVVRVRVRSGSGGGVGVPGCASRLTHRKARPLSAASRELRKRFFAWRRCSCRLSVVARCARLRVELVIRRAAARVRL